MVTKWAVLHTQGEGTQLNRGVDFLMVEIKITMLTQPSSFSLDTLLLTKLGHWTSQGGGGLVIISAFSICIFKNDINTNLTYNNNNK